MRSPHIMSLLCLSTSLGNGCEFNTGLSGQFLLQEHLPMSSRQGLEPNALSVVTHLLWFNRQLSQVTLVVSVYVGGRLCASHPLPSCPPGRLFRSDYLTRDRLQCWCFLSSNPVGRPETVSSHLHQGVCYTPIYHQSALFLSWHQRSETETPRLIK